MSDAHLVKYFSARDIEYYESGAFKVGTVESYKGTEADVIRLSDEGEGFYSWTIGTEDAYVESLSLPDNIEVRNFSGDPSGRGILIGDSFNEYVFCSTFGAYSPDHHLIMKDGGTDELGNFYAGNPELTHYALLDARRFLRALRSWACLSYSPIRPDFRPFEDIGGERVRYAERSSLLSVSNIDFTDSEMSKARYKAALLTKPNRFVVEKEFRIGLNIHYQGLPPLGADPLFPKSEKLRKSILSIGSL